ncbi:hypothetical protein [Microbulbifer hainanensis]|uniref:hypothetical protein n=1 Tax=Microbulbifer hainanensis TaxID=2735675 RepID=UPI0018673571|nr:hypothetical protein [Microbulbifer hainanensis]
MKKLFVVGTAAALMPMGNAYADTSVQIPLSGTLMKTCDVIQNLDGPFDNLNMSTTSEQGNEQVIPTCNYAGTVTLTFTSLNGGFLVSGSNMVAYNLIVDGGLLAPTQLTIPAVVAVWPHPVPDIGVPRNIRVALLSAATVAGTYTDTITASVTPN